MEFVVALLGIWGIISLLWLIKLQGDSTYQIGRIEDEIRRLDEDDDYDSDKVLDALKAAVKVLEDDDE